MTVEITKVSVNRTLIGQWAVTLNLKLIDEGTELFSQNFSEDYKTGDNVANIGAKFKDKMQETIDKYKSEQTIYNNTQLDTVVTALQNQLEV